MDAAVSLYTGRLDMNSNPSHRDPRNTAPRPPVIQSGGWPWLDIALGPDPQTGEIREARGVIAIGTRAFGVIAFGGMARGVIAIGGLAIGVASFGGISLGGLALGGLAVGYHALGGAAAGYSAQGGGAIGRYACGGAAWGEHALSPAHFFDETGPSPEALEFFGRYGNPGCRAMVSSYQTIERTAGMPPAQLPDYMQQQTEQMRTQQQAAIREAQEAHAQSMREAQAQLDQALRESQKAISDARARHREHMEALRARSAPAEAAPTTAADSPPPASP